jgi:hypothetical protein
LIVSRVGLCFSEAAMAEAAGSRARKRFRAKNLGAIPFVLTEKAPGSYCPWIMVVGVGFYERFTLHNTTPYVSSDRDRRNLDQWPEIGLANARRSSFHHHRPHGIRSSMAVKPIILQGSEADLIKTFNP